MGRVLTLSLHIANPENVLLASPAVSKVGNAVLQQGGWAARREW